MNPFHRSRGPLATNLPLFPRRLQLPIPLGLNLLLMPGEHVLRRGVSDGAVQSHIVVMLHDPRKLAEFRDPRVKASEEQIAQSREGNWQGDLLFVLKQEHEVTSFARSRWPSAIASSSVALHQSQPKKPQFLARESEVPRPKNQPSFSGRAWYCVGKNSKIHPSTSLLQEFHRYAQSH
jgi:hypothetical protein